MNAKIITLMYFILTTLSTVGYGDYYPVTRNEQIASMFLQFICLTVFAQVMSNIMGYIAQLEEDTDQKQEKLQKWFTLIIQMMKDRGDDKDETWKTAEFAALRQDIEDHFTHYNNNDRTSALFQ